MTTTEPHELVEGERAEERSSGHGGTATLSDAVDAASRATRTPLEGAGHEVDGERDRRRTYEGRLKAGLVVWDALVPVALLPVAAVFSGAFGDDLSEGPLYPYDRLSVVLAVISPPLLTIAGGYNQRRRRGGSRLMFALRLVLAGMALSWLSIMGSVIAGWPVDFAQMLALALLAPAGWLVGRWACDRHPVTAVDRVLLVGSGSIAEKVAGLTGRHPERRLVVVGRVGESRRPATGSAVPLLGDLADMPTVIERHRIDRVVVTFTAEQDSALLDRLRSCVALGVPVDVVPRFYDLMGIAPHALSLGGLALIEIPAGGLTVAQKAMKRGVDLLGAGLLVLLLSPVLVATAVAIAISDGRPVMFRQVRIGKGGREFRILKFRTMRTDSDSEGVARLAELADVGEADIGNAGVASVVTALKAASTTQVTRLGTRLRKSSIDELPQLLNILKGDMSLVGPRPLRPFEVRSLSPWQLARQDLRPGLTGLWQVLGRSEIDWEERMQLDYSYVSHWSFASDMQILARTLPAVVRTKGAV